MLTRTEFATFILTHGRPDQQRTLRTLERSGYTGRVYLIVDDEDPTLERYKERFGDMVIVFDKRAAARETDSAENTGNRKGVIYARNACWKIAQDLGLTHFLQLDDDYTSFSLRFNSRFDFIHQQIRHRLDDVLNAMFDWLDESGAACVAFSQAGDHVGGGAAPLNKVGPSVKRKAMNGFLLRTDRPFAFVGRINEDVNAYVMHGKVGLLFFTPYQAMLVQTQTQAQPGGMTEIYEASGTYYKSFMSVMCEPSCVNIWAMGSPEEGQAAHYRIHHRVDWSYAVPKILPERYRKPDEVTP